MRRAVLIVVACVSVVAVACAPKSSTSAAAPSGSGFETAAACMQANAADLYADGELTIGTGNPAYKPWYGGKSVEGSEWKAGAVHRGPEQRRRIRGRVRVCARPGARVHPGSGVVARYPLFEDIRPWSEGLRLRDAADLLLGQTGRGGRTSATAISM